MLDICDAPAAPALLQAAWGSAAVAGNPRCPRRGPTLTAALRDVKQRGRGLTGQRSILLLLWQENEEGPPVVHYCNKLIIKIRFVGFLFSKSPFSCPWCLGWTATLQWHASPPLDLLSKESTLRAMQFYVTLRVLLQLTIFWYFLWTQKSIKMPLTYSIFKYLSLFYICSISYHVLKFLIILLAKTRSLYLSFSNMSLLIQAHPNKILTCVKAFFC